MPEIHFPPSCPAPSFDWLLPHALPNTALAACRFNPPLWQMEDFERCGIAPARGAAKRQCEYLAGRLCAREALQQLTGDRSVPEVGEDGAPQWPTGVVGSITHGGGRALALVGLAKHYAGLGLDIEKWLPTARAERLHGEILTAPERQRAANLDLAWLTTVTFSLKESLFKALYPLVRRRFYFQDAELLEWDASGRARLRLLINLGRNWPAGSLLEGQFSATDEHLLSLIAIPT
jgi:enterobactin synthetase component D